MVAIETIIDAGLAPFAQQVGWQGFAYGLLGLKTMKRVFNWAREVAPPMRTGESPPRSENESGE